MTKKNISLTDIALLLGWGVLLLLAGFSTPDGHIVEGVIGGYLLRTLFNFLDTVNE